MENVHFQRQIGKNSGQNQTIFCLKLCKTATYETSLSTENPLFQPKTVKEFQKVPL